MIVAGLQTIKGIDIFQANNAVWLVELVTSQWIAKIVLLEKGYHCVVLNYKDKTNAEKMILDNLDIDIVE